MTIYAVVNNILGECAADNATPVWTIVSAASILQGGNPFFVPDFADRFEARLTLAVRIGKLGKGIAPKFVCRYVDAVAPAILFVAADLLSSLRKKGLPWTSALSYDRCLAMGKFTEISFEEINKSVINLSLLSKDNESKCEWKAESLLPSLAETISAISRDNTLKTGDIILTGISQDGPQAVPNIRASLSLNSVTSLAFNIR